MEGNTELGSRVIDKKFPYERARQKYRRELSYYLEFLKNAKKVATYKKIPYGLFIKPPTPCQKQAMVVVREAIRDTLADNECILTLEGGAGVGKSNTFFMIAELLTQLNVEFSICAPTAVSAAQYGGFTVHSLLGLYNIKQTMNEMVHAPVHPAVHERIKKLRVIILDECFLLGCRGLSLLCRRIRLIKKTTKTLPVTFMLGGDFGQLTVVGDVALYDDPKPYHDEMVLEGISLYRNRRYQITLTTNVRQNTDEKFQGILKRLHDDQITMDDVEALSKRLSSNLTDEQLLPFYDSVHIFSTNQRAQAWNDFYLLNSDISVRQLRPILLPFCEICEKDYPVSYVGTGAKIIFQRNIINQFNLCNGTLAKVEEVFFSNRNQSLPDFISCRVPSYTGPCLFEDNCVPIVPLQETIVCKHLDKKIRLTYYPIKNSYSRTTYKIQSITLQKVTINFEGFKFKDKGVYTSLSRCVKLDSVLIHSKKPLASYFFR